MSIMDFFSSQGTAVPSTGSSGGGWEDWFLDMENRAPFGGRTAYPDPDAERGDWIDWYLNREGPAGRFRGSKRQRHGIDYLFNGGGSVRSKPRSSPGPKTRQKLQPRSADVLGNISDRYYKERNLEGMRRMGQELQDRLQSHPSLQPGTGRILDTSPIEGGPIDPRSFWNVGLQSGDNSGIMTANNQQGKGKKWLDAYYINDEPENNSGIMELENNYNIEEYSPDGQGTWLTESPWGQKVLSGLVNKFASEGSSEYLQDAIGGGGFPLWSGHIRPTYEDGNVGVMWSSGG